MDKLADIAHPGVYCVQDIEDRGEETIRLKRLGICANRMLEVLQTGDPMIVRVVGTRIGVSRELGRSVTVTSVTALIPTSAQPDERVRAVGTA